MKNTKYPNGYWPKIEYWYTLLDQAIKSKNTEDVLICIEKIEYFNSRQKMTEISIEL